MPDSKNSPAPELQRMVGQCYVFCRESHDWDCCEVAVLSIEGKRFRVARAVDVCESLLAKTSSKRRKIKTWRCTADELF